MTVNRSDRRGTLGVALVLLLTLASVCHAQDVNVDSWIPSGDSRCNSGAWTRVDRTPQYKTSSTATKIICVRSYMNVCNGAQGVIPCNTATSSCKAVGYDYQDTVLYPNVQTVGRPEVCAAVGGTFLSTTQVLIVAQVVFAFVLYIGAMIPILIVACRSAYGGLASAILVCQLAVCLLLCFSFLYLSGLVKLAGSMVAVVLFQCRNHTMTGIGCLFLLAVFLWTTFAFGMGHAVHARLTAAPTNFTFFQDQCNAFYEGYFTFIPELATITENPAQGPILICSRTWVAAIFFFEFISELLLVLLAAVGVFGLPKVHSTTTKTQA